MDPNDLAGIKALRAEFDEVNVGCTLEQDPNGGWYIWIEVFHLGRRVGTVVRQNYAENPKAVLRLFRETFEHMEDTGK